MKSILSFEEFELDYPPIHGIACHTRHVRLGYLLNRHSDLEVFYHDDIKTHEGDSVHGAFLISFLDDKSECLLIKNRGTNSFFYKKYRKLDYFLCPMDEEEINPKIIRIVKGFKDISVCFVLDKPNQKDILNFAQLQ